MYFTADRKFSSEERENIGICRQLSCHLSVVGPAIVVASAAVFIAVVVSFAAVTVVAAVMAVVAVVIVRIHRSRHISRGRVRNDCRVVSSRKD